MEPADQNESQRKEEALRKTLDATRIDDQKVQQQHEVAEGLGAAGAAGIGCLSTAAMPFTIVGLVILGLIAIWVLKGCAH